MRVISGKARRSNLETVKGLDIRPTTDRIKETLFNIINPFIYDSCFLDLFSGSGAIGIEALSRGAKSCIFVDNNKSAIECIKKNLNTTRLTKDAEILNKDAINALRLLEGRGQAYDIIFMDPPYDLLLEKETLEYLAKSNMVDKDTIIIVEVSLNTSFDYIKGLGFKINKKKEYKNNAHIFIIKEE